MFVVDTNILVYAADRDSPYHARCRDLVSAWRASPSAWYVTWGICYEFLRVVTHPRVMQRSWQAAVAWRVVEALLATPGLGVLMPTDRHADVAAEVVADHAHITGNLWHDATTVVLMREHGVGRIYTRDMDFHRFAHIQPIDPTGSGNLNGVHSG